ncbi:MAG TPA: helix-turn-helix domain-containing protein, partial [Polyangiaceae bacterium]|nr:helix-turn-helix domain-containing protein [Polyangiaceae bacterium]
ARVGTDLSGLPNSHAFLGHVVANNFAFLRVGASLWDHKHWHSIQGAGPLLGFEFGHGKGSDRHAYNVRSGQQVYREKRTVRARHAGFSDFFVPVGTRDRVQAVLVSGPFATERPTASEILERWYSLTGRQGHPSDLEFSHYVSSTLETLTLEGDQLRRYERFLECVALLIAGSGDARALADEAASLGGKLEETRLAERMNDAVRTMVDERSATAWLSPQRADELSRLDVELPEHALVALIAGRPGERNALQEILKRDAFQRACVELARASKNVLSARIADHGVAFLVPGGRSGARVRSALSQLADRISGLARRGYGLGLHFGTNVLDIPAPLNVRYEQALGAAERALFSGISLVHASPDTPRNVSPVRRLRADLGRISEERPKALSSRFDRFMEAVGIHSGYRLDLARAYLEAGFDQAAQALLATGALQEKSHLDMCDSLERAARDASTVSDLFAAYRLAVAELVDVMERPAAAAQDRSLRRALSYVHEHFNEPINLPQIARIAGFSPNYFGQLFKRRERSTFEGYVRRLRVERAKELLMGTELSAERVGQLSGFPLRHYFHRVFKELVGVTPAQYRTSRPARIPGPTVTP